jgi:hypothetical protein
MATAATPMPISADAQDAVVKYLNSALDMYSTSYNIRSQMELRDKAYYRTNDGTTAQSRAKAANDAGDITKTQNITVPVVMPQVESALAYLQETFLSGYPIFGTVSTPDQIDAATQMDTLIGENSIRAGWPLEFLQSMRDGLKYDLGAVEVTWQNRKLFALTTPQEQNIQQGTPTETYYQGNFVKRLDPYNLILDTRVSPEKNHTEGEFAGYSEIVSRIECKKRMEDLPPMGTMNFRRAFETPGANISNSDANASFYIPQINPDALLPVENRQTHNWMAWANLTADAKDTGGINYSDSYEYTTLYARILPSDFKINTRNKNHVQIWKFIVINKKVVIFAERQTNAHNYLPIVVCKPSADGMSWQSKSFAENATPIQSVSSSLVNSALESQRRKVYDRMFYDPSRVRKQDIDQISSVARIPVKNSGYGKPIADAVHQMPFRDDGVAEIMGLSQQITQMADVVNGQNRVQQGQFQKGNKTRQEFDTVMSNASSRQKMQALALEYSFFVPIKEIIKSNILQFQPPTTLTNRDANTNVAVDPEVLRKANLSFSLSDGFLPSDKLMSGDQFATVFQAAQAIPSINMEYDLMGMFIYSMKLRGANWMNSFKRTPEQTQQQMALTQQSSVATGGPQASQPAVGAPQQ